MSHKPPTLIQLIESLIKSPTRKIIRLPRGLRLAYTPGHENTEGQGEFRLVLSRKGNVRPSPAEDGIVLGALRQALKNAGRQLPTAPALTPNISLNQTPCTLITWREAQQIGLFEEEE